LPFENRTATTPPALEIVLVSADWEEPDGFVGACVVVVVVFFAVVVVVDRRVVEVVDPFESEFGLGALVVVAVVDVGPGGRRRGRGRRGGGRRGDVEGSGRRPRARERARRERRGRRRRRTGRGPGRSGVDGG
jgi:hypothetical protein